MDNMKSFLKYSAVWLLSLSAISVDYVGAAAVAQSYGSVSRQRCGYGFPACPYGYQCVRVGYRSRCRRRRGYNPRPTPTDEPTYPLGYPTQQPPTYPPGDTPTYPPGESPTYPPGEPPTYPPGEFPTYPPGESPTYPPGETPTYPPGETPTYPPGEEPTYPPGETPTYPPGEEPTYPPGETPTYPPGEEPTYPPGETPTYPPGGEPTYPPNETPTYPSESCSTGYGYTSCTTYKPRPTYPPYGGGGGGGGNNCTRPGNCGGGGGGGNNRTFTPIVGVPGRVVSRLPINVLQRDRPDTFNMLLLAFESLQQRDESNTESYYQVSGIHGFPFIPWQYPPEATANPGYGYCTHGSRIFTTWHRPYVLLLEQLLYEEANRIAEQFTDDKYRTAAQDLRLPYWDWASDDTQSRIPDALMQQSIRVVKPGDDGSENETEIPNPLYTYRFRNPQPAESGLEGAVVRSGDANEILFATFPGRQEATLDLFALTDYDSFSSTCEDIHGTVHVMVGEDMAEVRSSAFDPIFWLHHCQVDRLMAMYQATHPGLTLTPGPRSPTFALGGDGPDDLSTPLYPFRHDNGNEWTSDEVKTAESIFTYGYDYPEVPNGRSGEDLRAYTAEQVNRLYGPDTNDASFQGDESGAPESPTARREWGANVIVNMQEIPGSHRILIHLGPHDKANPDPQKDIENLVGVAPIFTGPDPKPNMDRYLNFTVPLTPALVQKHVPLRPEDTVPTLSDLLYWTVERVGDSVTPVPVTELPSLKVSVVSTVTEYSEDKSELPVRTEKLTHYAPTVGKPAGLQPGEEAPIGSEAPAALDENVAGGNGTSSGNSTTPAS